MYHNTESIFGAGILLYDCLRDSEKKMLLKEKIFKYMDTDIAQIKQMFLKGQLTFFYNFVNCAKLSNYYVYIRIEIFNICNSNNFIPQ